MPDMKAHHKKGKGRSCQQNDYIIVEHYYHYDIFNAITNFYKVKWGFFLNMEAIFSH